MQTSNIIASIDDLLEYAVKTGLIQESDYIQKRNALSDLLKVDLGEEEKSHDTAETELVLAQILDNITQYAAQTGLIPRNTTTYRDLFDTRVMGMLTPRESEVIQRFWEIRNGEKDAEDGMRKATDYFYALCQASNYIRTDRIQKNCKWVVPTEFGSFIITVNLSKPEKDPRDIAEAAQTGPGNYPKCELCVENVGYAGRIDHPARQNLRVIPLVLGGEQWYFQYSPYVYYREHCILLSQEHRPLVVDRGALVRMFDFIENFPHYFLGSNAGLPIVGGSILNHDHYQGGREVFPLDLAPFEYTFTHPDFPEVRAGTAKWPMSVIRLEGRDRKDLTQLGSAVIDTWREYEDESADIVPYTLAEAREKCSHLDPSSTKVAETCGNGIDAVRIPHNAVTATLRREPNGNFVLNLILRNNRTTPAHPCGVFHPREDLHHIKKENIGVIEAMGMAILPGRLDRELQGIERILCGETPIPSWIPENDGHLDENEEGQTSSNEKHMLYKHRHWIDELVARYGNNLASDEACEVLRSEVGQKFLEVLLDAGVFKRDCQGKRAFGRFIKTCGFNI